MGMPIIGETYPPYPKLHNYPLWGGVNCTIQSVLLPCCSLFTLQYGRHSKGNEATRPFSCPLTRMVISKRKKKWGSPELICAILGGRKERSLPSSVVQSGRYERFCYRYR